MPRESFGGPVQGAGTRSRLYAVAHVGDRERRGTLTAYSDSHSIFQLLPNELESISEQLRGKRDPTQFGRFLERLDIILKLAHTSLDKGRIERVWDSFQDWLISELRMAGATTREQTNGVLRKCHAGPQLPVQRACSPTRLCIPPVPRVLCLDVVLRSKYLRTLTGDNIVGWGGSAIQLTGASMGPATLMCRSGGPGKAEWQSCGGMSGQDYGHAARSCRIRYPSGRAKAADKTDLTMASTSIATPKES